MAGRSIYGFVGVGSNGDRILCNDRFIQNRNRHQRRYHKIMANLFLQLRSRRNGYFSKAGGGSADELNDADIHTAKQRPSHNAYVLFVTFTDGTTVQSGTTAFGTTDLTLNATISSVDLTRTLAAASSFQRGGESNYTGDDQPAVGWFTTTLSSATNLQLTRGNALSSTATVSWFVVQFPAATLNSFGYMKTITIDRTKVGVSGTSNLTLSNFPFLVNITDANLATTAHGGHVTKPTATI